MTRGRGLGLRLK